MKPIGRRGPPRRAERVLGRFIPDGAAGRASVLGDLHEEYLDLRLRRGRSVADLWYCAQAVLLSLPWMSAYVAARAGEASSGLLLDLRSTLRGLRRHPTLVLVGVVSLALGSGLVTAAATVVNGAWFAPLPWAEADRLVDLEDTHPTQVCQDCSPGTSLRSLAIWREELGGLFERIEATERRRGSVRAGAIPLEAAISASTPGMAELLGLELAIGRFFAGDDLEVGAEGVAVLSHGFWVRAFGADPGVVGREIQVDGEPHTVVGVLGRDARPLARSDLFVPIREEAVAGGFGDRGVWVVGRLAQGVSVGAADEALAAVAEQRYAADPELEAGWSARAVPLRTVLARSGSSAGTAFTMMSLCLIVLLVAALNLAALLLARATQRTHELGVRSALGAGRLRVARAAVLDALVLAVAGGVGGAFLTWSARDAVVAAFADDLPPWASFPIDLRVLTATVGGIVLAAAVTGLLPLTRSLALGGEPGRGGAASAGRQRPNRAPYLLLGAQIVLGLVLVAGSAGALRTFVEVSDFDRLGHRWSGLVDVRVALPRPQGGGGASLASRVDAALSEHPAVEGHTIFRSLFLGSWGTEEVGSPVRVAGAAEPMANHRVPRHSLAVGPGYFDLNQVPIVAGRGITRADGEGEVPVAVVSDGAARVMWPDRAPADAIGETFAVTVGETSRSFTVVGVAAPVVARAWSENAMPEPRIYTPLAQTPEGLFDASPQSGLVVRVDPRGIGPSPEEWAVWLNEVAPDAAVHSVANVEDILRDSIRGIWLAGAILGGLAGLVLVLLAIGIYGTVSYRVATARRDIGIRLALGAPVGGVIQAVAGRLARVVGWAILAGAALAWAADRTLAAGGVPIGDADPRVLVPVSLLMAGAAALACALPLRTALRIDPAGSMRSD